MIEEIKGRVVSGIIPGGERIQEEHLSRELSVSRTPIREALIALENEGLLESIPGRGFSVLPLSLREARETYPIVGCLEASALAMLGAPTPEVLAELDELNTRIREGGHDPLEAHRLDEQWHRLLLRGVPNGKLMSLIDRLKGQLRRYEYAYMARWSAPAFSAQGHREITEALSEGALDRATDLLERHWQSGVMAFEEWLGEEGEDCS